MAGTKSLNREEKDAGFLHFERLKQEERLFHTGFSLEIAFLPGERALALSALQAR
jgi:hypothetical protein